jgi:hypothetical protein
VITDAGPTDGLLGPLPPSTRGPARTPLPLRTLPFRVPPCDGESLQSWLVANASRAHTPWFVLLDALLPKAQAASRVGRYGCLDEILRPRQLTDIATATGMTEQRVAEMTLAGLRMPPVQPDTGAWRVSTPWGRPVRWRRYCPRCLERTGGRWSLAWRLPWVAVCVDHGCLLNDTCPACGGKQYGAPGCRVDRHPPRTELCCCTGDLRIVPSQAIPAASSMIDAQRAVNAMVGREVITAGIYAHAAVSGAQLLADVRRLAHRVLVAGTPTSLSAAFEGDRPTTELWLTRLWRPSRHGDPACTRFTTNAPCAVVAVGTTAALHILQQPTLERAAAALARLAPGARGNPIHPGDDYRGYRPSAALCAVEVVAQSAHWDTLEKVRFGIYGPLPRRLAPPETTQTMMRSIPSLMWVPWAAALDVIDHDVTWPTYRRTLSWLMLEIGARPLESTIRHGLRATTDRQRIHQAVESLSRDRMWPRVAGALSTLHAHLAQHPAPIDYQRRRELHYGDLLTEGQWQQLWKHADAVHPRPVSVRVARAWLYERLSGSHAGTRGAVARDRCDIDRLLLRLTPDLTSALDEHAAQFLRRCGISEEPVTWTPPLGVLGRDAFASSLDQIDVAALHALLRTDRCTVPHAAEALGHPVHLVRHRLEEHPMAPREAPRRTWKQRLADALSEEELLRLYTDDGLTFTDIGARYGIPHRHVAQRARECGVTPRRPTREPIPAQWIREHHLQRRQTTAEMAAELDDDISRVRYWAGVHGIPLRKYYRRAQQHDVIRHATALGVLHLLTPQRLDTNGWNQLQRFAIASTHHTLADAARAIGCRPDTLYRQIIRLETAFGFPLIERTTSRHTPMTVTATGEDIAKAVLRIEHHMNRPDHRH